MLLGRPLLLPVIYHHRYHCPASVLVDFQEPCPPESREGSGDFDAGVGWARRRLDISQRPRSPSPPPPPRRKYRIALEGRRYENGDPEGGPTLIDL